MVKGLKKISTTYGLDYFTNEKNIPNQELVHKTIEYFETGEGKRAFKPLEFLNLLEKQYHFVNDNIKKNEIVISHLKALPLNEIEQHYSFDNNFIRVEINPDAVIPEAQSFEDYLNYSLERSIAETGTKVLIIDNLTYLKNETEKAKDALPLMKHLKALKNKYSLSILCLAHTPKRDLSKPITRNDLQGSKMLINLCDSSFSIGESSNDKNTRYIKQIKARNTEIIYDTENVCICHIEKPYNFLQFEFLNFGTEQEHLKQISESEKSEIENSIKDLLQTEPGLTAYAIAKKLCKDESKFNSFIVKVSRIVNRISNSSNI